MSGGVVISGIGQISAVGQGQAAFLEGLRGLRAPRIEERATLTRQGERRVLVYPTPAVVLPPSVPEAVNRRMARFSKMAFAATFEAIEDSLGREGVLADPERVGIVVGTAFGPLDLASQFERRLCGQGPAGASPTLFAASVQNSIASHLSISFGIRGPACTVTTMEQTVICSLRTAYDWIQQGVVDHVLIALGDEISEFHAYAMAHLARPSAFAPTLNECTAVVGEGMVSLMLSRAGLAPKSYLEIQEVQPWTDTCPSGNRFAVSPFGAKGQWERYRRWIGQEPITHASLYGGMIAGLGFELAAAALTGAKDTVCVQLTDRNEAQTLRLI